MIISDEVIFNVLLIIKLKTSPVSNDDFNRIIEKELPNIPSGHFRQKVEYDEKFLQYNKDEDTISLTPKGIKFLRKHKFKNFLENNGTLIIIILSIITIVLMVLFNWDKITCKSVTKPKSQAEHSTQKE